ncbi:mucoidy inhibitor MuiA family protein [Chryseolinea sp. T2]|uniref:mucoidy inhibitor MuiA family protein n=1 Tax=Chryseolinea sp. T2 TaxID=3129255 RepID=UPI003077672D
MCTILSLFIVSELYSQTFKEKEVKTEINEVTVFLNGAQVFESGTTTIPAGKTILKIRNLSPYLDEKSLQVKADGDFTILSVNHKLNFLSELKKDAKIDSLKKAADAIELAMARDNARLGVLKEKQSLLNENKNLGGETSGATITQLKQAIEFYESEISKIKEEEISTNKHLELKKKEHGKIEQQLKELNEQNSLPASEVEIGVSAEQQVNTKVNISYLVANAGWYPKYDIRVENIKSPLELTYRAEVFQNTGVDWKNVKLRFSNGDPNQSGVVPELNAWNLNYARNTTYENSLYGMAVSNSIRNVRGIVISESDGKPIPGVNVLVKGTTVGTTTGAGGDYSLTLPNNASTLVFSFIGLVTQEVAISKPDLNIRMQDDVTQLSEVVVTGYGAERALQGRMAGVQIRGSKSIAKPVPTTVIENQTTVEIEVATPYTVKSNGEKIQVDLKKHQIESVYEYYAIPKLDKDAFLVAQIINWDQYNLLEGEANLYFEDAYVGRTILNAKSLQDTLAISLGRDKSIVIGREKNEQFSKRKTIGSNVVETRGFKIIARNKKSQPIKLTIFDQIPVSVVSDITVGPLELTSGQIDPKTGKVKWELTIDGQQQKDINLQYEVKYPKREKVVLE